jgi:hypothetical protein
LALPAKCLRIVSLINAAKKKPVTSEDATGQTQTRGEGREKLGTKKPAIGGSLFRLSWVGFLEFRD